MNCPNLRMFGRNDPTNCGNYCRHYGQYTYRHEPFGIFQFLFTQQPEPVTPLKMKQKMPSYRPEKYGSKYNVRPFPKLA